jgi:hypothetical protein
LSGVICCRSEAREGKTVGDGDDWHPTLRGTYCVSMVTEDGTEVRKEVHAREFLNVESAEDLQRRHVQQQADRRRGRSDGGGRGGRGGHGGGGGGGDGRGGGIGESKFTAASSSTADDEYPSMRPAGPMAVGDRIKCLVVDGRWYPGTLVSLHEKGGRSTGYMGVRFFFPFLFLSRLMSGNTYDALSSMKTTYIYLPEQIYFCSMKFYG